ncbi:zinc-ribbon domain-containing protein [Ascidiimonas sp. W6]|uniref:zinc-ribbon domain-containing protein n=1 Tax=Ascidiimonas meishanensis TaxID=3128903 RepID=UPI0030ED79D7
MLIFGSRATNIGSLKIENSQCEYCQTGRTQIITNYGMYFHIFWIPVFPLGNKTFGECTHCKRTFKKKEFNPELREIYDEKKWMIKRPIWHWLGLIYIILLIALIVIYSEFYQLK